MYINIYETKLASINRDMTLNMTLKIHVIDNEERFNEKKRINTSFEFYVFQ